MFYVIVFVVVVFVCFLFLFLLFLFFVVITLVYDNTSELPPIVRANRRELIGGIGGCVFFVAILGVLLAVIIITITIKKNKKNEAKAMTKM